VDIKDQLKETAAAHAKVVRDAAAAQAVVAKDAAAAHARLMMSDIWHAMRTDRIVQLMLLILVLSIACGDLPGVKEFLYPFSMFKTMVHECGHALAVRLTGGHVTSIMLNPSPDAYGVTMFHGGNPWLYLPAGYMGLAIFGALLIWWGRKPADARFVLQSIGTAMLAVTLFYGSGSVPNFLMMLFIACSIFIIARKAPERVCHFFLIFLAVQTSLEALVSLKAMVWASALMGGMGDAKAMEEMTGVPSLVWTSLWATVSLALFIFAFWFSYRPTASTKTGSTSAAPVSPAAGPEPGLPL